MIFRTHNIGDMFDEFKHKKTSVSMVYIKYLSALRIEMNFTISLNFEIVSDLHVNR